MQQSDSSKNQVFENSKSINKTIINFCRNCKKFYEENLKGSSTNELLYFCASLEKLLLQADIDFINSDNYKQVALAQQAQQTEKQQQQLKERLSQVDKKINSFLNNNNQIQETGKMIKP